MEFFDKINTVSAIKMAAPEGSATVKKLYSILISSLPVPVPAKPCDQVCPHLYGEPHQ